MLRDLCRHVRAAFTQDILQAGAVKGLIRQLGGEEVGGGAGREVSGRLPGSVSPDRRDGGLQWWLLSCRVARVELFVLPPSVALAAPPSSTPVVNHFPSLRHLHGPLWPRGLGWGVSFRPLTAMSLRPVCLSVN